MPKINETFTAETQIRPDRAYSLDTAAKALTICTRTLSEQIKRGAIRAIPVGKRRRAIPGAEILRVLSGGTPTTPETSSPST